MPRMILVLFLEVLILLVCTPVDVNSFIQSARSFQNARTLLGRPIVRRKAGILVRIPHHQLPFVSVTITALSTSLQSRQDPIFEASIDIRRFLTKQPDSSEVPIPAEGGPPDPVVASGSPAPTEYQRRKPPKSDMIECKGKVIESLPNCMFRVQLEPSRRIVLATLSGGIKKNKLRVVIGDSVLVDVSVYDINRGRIVVRYR
jgi:translation initiation factor IF-1